MTRLEIRVTGIVQGVGFRPFVHRLSQQLGVCGWVRNDGCGVLIEAEADDNALELFCAKLTECSPRLSVIENITAQAIKPVGETGFSIADSDAGQPTTTLLLPDIATCQSCLQELLDPADRRYRYPFINCTECGPRYTIVRGLPYDRPATAMAGFDLCPDCGREYGDPHDRRFHAQPNACRNCGPSYRLLNSAGDYVRCGDIVAYTRELVEDGAVVAIKGIGGWHLACCAKNDHAVNRIRLSKGRDAKPLAVMAGSMAAIERICQVSAIEAELLTGYQRPIVLLEKAKSYNLADSVAPHNRRLGVMLPYAPVHWLLLEENDIWVMTSGNRTNEPIAYASTEQLRQAGLADFYLDHNRSIEQAADDSVLFVVNDIPVLSRRSRGFVPVPLKLSGSVPILATGGDLKNTFCLVRDSHCFISPHIGDLASGPVFDSYRRLIDRSRTLFGIQPSLVAHDLHPGYWSTRYAVTSGLPTAAVQHHHAHIAAVIAEYGLQEPVIGVALDGTGYGHDGAVWGGEFLIVDGANFSREAHFGYLPLPGGEQAVREPWRLAAWLLSAIYDGQTENRQPELASVLPEGWQVVAGLPAIGLHSPLTSSAGRLFDAAAALIGKIFYNHYEGHAAALLEALAGNTHGQVLPYRVIEDKPLTIDFLPVFAALLEKQTCEPAEMAAAFHETVAHAVTHVVSVIAETSGIRTVALGGGVWQNARLFASVVRRLERLRLKVCTPRKTPINDGGLCLGQAYVARKALTLKEH